MMEIAKAHEGMRTLVMCYEWGYPIVGVLMTLDRIENGGRSIIRFSVSNCEIRLPPGLWTRFPDSDPLFRWVLLVDAENEPVGDYLAVPFVEGYVILSLDEPDEIKHSYDVFKNGT